jgi:hypothetical protein
MARASSGSFRSPVWAETLGDHPDVISHDYFVGQRNPDLSIPLPPDLLLGSFRGQLKKGMSIQSLGDFSLVFQNYKVLGKGIHLGKQFLISGKFNAVGVSDECRILLAASQRNFRVSENSDEQGFIPPASGRRSTSSSNPEESPFAGVMELRCEYTDELIDHEGVNQGCGFIGDWYGLEEAEGGGEPTLNTGKIILWPTPSTLRQGGYLSFTFMTPVCGIEHSGSLIHWHGVGVEVKGVHEPAATHGVKPGDVIKFIGGTPVPMGKTSAEISNMIRAAARPLVLLVWRDVVKTNFKSLNLIDVEPVEEESESTTLRIMKTFHSMEHITADLKRDMMGELFKKRQSLDSIKQKRETQVPKNTTIMES